MYLHDMLTSYEPVKTGAQDVAKPKPDDIVRSLSNPTSVHSQVSPVSQVHNNTSPPSSNAAIVSSPELHSDASDSNSASHSSAGTVCQNCQTSTTPLWRRDENGQVLCNACGLFLKLHGRRRPISLKTDVIKSRNRSRNNPVAIKRTKNNQQSQIHIPNASPGNNSGSPSFPALSPHVVPHGSPLRHPLHDLSHIDHLPLSAVPPWGSAPYPHNHHSSHHHHLPSTPSTVFSYPNSPTLGPQAHHTHVSHHHLYPQGYNSVPASNAASPKLNPLNGGAVADHHHGLLPPPRPNRGAATNHGTPHILTPLSRPQSPVSTLPAVNGSSLRPLRLGARGEALSEQLRPRSPEVGLERIPLLRNIPASHKAAEKSQTNTRVSELELVNDLLRSRVSQLEQSESSARKAESTIRESELMLRKTVEKLREENEQLKTKLRAVGIRDQDDEPKVKRIKVSELL
jgi:GATA-binding protein